MTTRFHAHSKSKRRPRFAVAALAGAALCTLAGGARAQYTPPTAGMESSNPYYLRLAQSFVYDDNIFRAPGNLPPPFAQVDHDWVSSTALSAGIDQHFGRQRAILNGTVRGNVFRDNDELNNTGYDLGAQLKWEAGSAWAGDARVNFSQTLAKFEDYGTAQRTIGKNMEKVGLVDLRAQYGLYSLWSIEGLYNHYDISYTADVPDFNSRERESDQAGLGVKFRPSGLWTFGLQWRETRGEYPHYRVAPAPTKDEYDRTDVDLTARYFATGLSTLSARLSHTEEEHSIDSTRDFSGLTGEIRWDYQATGKLGVSTTLSRDTGSGSSSTNLGGTTTYLSDSRLSERIAIYARWQATGKIIVRAGLDFSHDTYDDQFTSIDINGQLVSASGSTADSRMYTLSAAYQMTRAVSFECGYRYQKRDPIITSGTQFLGYTSNTGYCTGTLGIQ